MTRRVGLPLLAVLGAGLALRLWVMLTQTYVVFADETFQYLEQGHRLAFGTGVLPWEFQDGIRSWLLPGAVAGLMRVAAWFSDDPLAYLRLVRGVCVLVSLVVVAAGFDMARRREGLAAAVLTGGFCALWFDLVYFAPSVLTEVIAAHLVVLALWLGDDATRQGRRRWVAIGLCCGLAVVLRFQYGPAMAVALAWQNRLDWRRWGVVLAAGAATVAVGGGVLDWLTWGAPLQSVWLNLVRNSVDGVSTAIGADPAWFYLAYLDKALWPAPAVLFLAVVGAMRVPALALAAAVTLVLHAAVPHKEIRFIYLALAVLPILAGLGAAALLRALAGRLGGWLAPACVPVLLVLAALASWYNATGPALAGRWSFNRAHVEAFLAAGRQADLCGLGARDMRLIDSGGYAYLHRDVPLLFQQFDPSIVLDGARVPLRFAVMRHGAPVDQAPGAAFAMAAGRFNYLVGETDGGLAGFRRVACFQDASRADKPPLCLFRRDGGCAERGVSP